MFDGRDLEDAARMIEDWQAGVEARAAQTRELSGRLAAVTATARSDDGLVELTVGATGDLVRLELGEGIRGRPADETARAILATLHAARQALTAQVTAVTTEVVGAESETGRAVIESYARRLRAPDE
ncbi:YbaB/EbfC family nucleoid-associated protein [Paractinoplanes lichenicola]|uniref:YbaB/EbfC family nucleoid-associated protein n=1 Tax=Paractinoplanes lichenicola TaxID=2802976 RepID=A0ABS1W1J9_9ACTN|nr:YbaB/EbfC family nucleoid-associated protein [Actinoplanes lichenicola]MBL7260590.1 YbaB/EbfC family nucleoid-associated protein [Actinoplanes lichenicola]